MADRTSNIRIVDPVLTSMAWGYKNSELVAEALFPVVPMDKEAGKIPVFGKEAFKLYNSKRAIRGGSNVMTPDGITTVDPALEEYDLAYPIDYREENEASFNLEEIGVNHVSEAMETQREYDAAALATNASNYGSNTTNLDTTAQWTDSDDSNPITDVQTGKSAIRSCIGREPNVMVLGYKSFDALAYNEAILERIKYAQTGIVTIDMLQVIFGIPKIVVGKRVYSTDAGVLTDIWGDVAILAYIPPATNAQRDIYEPSFGYTFRRKGMPEVDTYFTNGGKTKNVRRTDIRQVKIVGATAGYLIEDTCA